jgi:hypothetical protein
VSEVEEVHVPRTQEAILWGFIRSPVDKHLFSLRIPLVKFDVFSELELICSEVICSRLEGVKLESVFNLHSVLFEGA